MTWTPAFIDIRNAAQRLAGVSARTPLLTSDILDEAVGRRTFLKPEMLQRTGSFKFRGAYNRLSHLSSDEQRQGVIAWSSGNHAQGVAAAARELGVNATIVMPADAPAVKRSRTEAYGAVVVPYDRNTESREEIAHALAREHGGIVVPSYDDPFIIAGQGTTGLEIAEDVERYGAQLDALLVCCGGGGLIAGCALAMEALSPETHVYSVEPEYYDDHARSLASGKREHAETARSSICDALLAPQPGELTFRINGNRLAGGIVVTEREVAAAMQFAFGALKLVVEPGGAVALAALLAGKLERKYRTVGVVLSGGNVDPALFLRLLGTDTSCTAR